MWMFFFAVSLRLLREEKKIVSNLSFLQNNTATKAHVWKYIYPTTRVGERERAKQEKSTLICRTNFFPEKKNKSERIKKIEKKRKVFLPSFGFYFLPEHAWGGSGKIKVVELLRRATMDPSDCGLKLRNCCMKSEHSMSATSVPIKMRK